jgi:hypothetical protein
LAPEFFLIVATTVEVAPSSANGSRKLARGKLPDFFAILAGIFTELSKEYV